MQATTILCAPKGRQSKENAASYSMGTRPGMPQSCANRPTCNKGDKQKLWVHPKFSISFHLNAQHVLGKTPTGVYFIHFTNKQFHHLTT
jgi:hypothetical protein